VYAGKTIHFESSVKYELRTPAKVLMTVVDGVGSVVRTSRSPISGSSEQLDGADTV